VDQASQARNNHPAAEASSRSEVLEIGLPNRRWMLGEQREHDLFRSIVRLRNYHQAAGDGLRVEPKFA